MNIQLPDGLGEFTVLFVRALWFSLVKLYDIGGWLSLPIAISVLVIFTAHFASKFGTDENAPFDIPRNTHI